MNYVFDRFCFVFSRQINARLCSVTFSMERHIYSECSNNVLLEQLALFYAQAVKNLLFIVSRRMCYGCQEQILSQTLHSCITLTAKKVVSLFLQNSP